MEHVPFGATGMTISRIGLGGMPLSIQGRPKDRRAAKRVVQRAVELGVTFIDTADVYCLDDADIGHNERLIREALDEMEGSPDVVIATKGGLTRPGGGWETDARPAHLREACERSLKALDVERIDLYQLHAPDPHVPLEDSVGELARLRDEGKIRAVGLSNVDREKLDLARDVVEIVSVQNRFSPFDRTDEESGLIGYCDENTITYIPYGPVGGGRRVQRLRESAPLRRFAERFDASPEEVVLAWVLTKSASLVPIPGASRVASIESSVRALDLELDAPALRELESLFSHLDR